MCEEKSHDKLKLFFRQKHNVRNFIKSQSDKRFIVRLQISE